MSEGSPRNFAMVSFRVNGKKKVVMVDPSTSLLDTLRDELGITGPKKGCDQSVCGACTVLFNGRAIYSCTMLVPEAGESEITTIEGLANKDGSLDPLQKAFIDNDAMQCSYCTPGQIMAAKEFLMNSDLYSITDESIKEALSGNLCRCGCYNNIVAAVKSAATTMRNEVGR